MALFVGGLFLPGGGYASGGKAVKTVVSHVDNVDEVYDASYQAHKVFSHNDEASAAGNSLDTADDANDIIKVTDDAPTNPKVPNICSFTADTPVLTINGLVAISSMTVGTLVWAWDETTQTTGWYTVTATWGHADSVLVDMAIDGVWLTTTPEHPFYTHKGWVAAGDLWLGDAIRSADGTWGTVTALRLRGDTQVMYNLTVAEAHTFFVGDGQWLVHNTCIPDLQGTARGQLLGQVKDFLRTFEGTAAEKADAIEALYTQVSQKSSTRWIAERFDLADGATVFERPGQYHTVVDSTGTLWKGNPDDYVFDKGTKVLVYENMRDFFQ